MPNEIRPCTLPAHWKQKTSFDACDVIQIRNMGTRVVIDLESVKFVNGHPYFGKVINSPFYDEYLISSQQYLQEAITTIAEALNAPVLATEEVFDAMEKVPEAKFSMVGINEYGKHTYPVNYSKMRGGWYVYNTVPKALKIGDYIQADCPLALQVLLQFNVEGEKHA